MRKPKKLLLVASGMALSGFLVSACSKDPIGPSTQSVAPAESSLGTVNAKSSSNAAEYQRLLQPKKSGAPGEVYAKKKRSGYMVSSS